MPNASAYYKVVLNGRYNGQAIVNLLYYRLADEYVPGPLNFAGAEDLAFQVKQEIWTSGMGSRYPADYFLENITVYPMDNDFVLLYQMPFVMAVNENGWHASLPSDGPAACVIARFNLEPTSPLNGIFPPRTGYVALGPVASLHVENDGNLTVDGMTLYTEVAATMAQNLENLVPPAVFYPIRVKITNVLGVIKIRSFADVSSAVVRSRVSFRRSRIAEA